jgi:uridine phosphorylase
MLHVIPESELILNEDGSVYHLNLLPPDLADDIIFVGDPDRVEKVSAHFDRIEMKKEKREFITHTGYIGSKRISVLSTGIGTDNIDIVLNEIDMLKNIDLDSRQEKKELSKCRIYRVGTSGALQADIPVDSLLVSTHGVGLDGVMNYYQIRKDLDIENQIYSQLGYDFIAPYLSYGSIALIDKFDESFLRGVTATCCGFYAPQGRMIRKNIVSDDLVQRLSKLNFSNIGSKPELSGLRVTNFEMETSAIYGLSALFGFDAISVNAIMANRITNKFSKQGAKTIENAIVKTLEVICK